MMKALLVVLVALFAPACHAEETCDLQHPPRVAAVTALHGQYLFIYPDGLPSKFTGCQIVWTESAHRLFVFRFKNGVIEQLTVDYPQPAQPGNTNFDCQYSEGNALGRSSDDCLRWERSKGFPRQGYIPELIPPPERDPRR